MTDSLSEFLQHGQTNEKRKPLFHQSTSEDGPVGNGQ